MAEIINPFETSSMVYLGLPGLVPSTVAGWFMGVQEADRSAIVGFAPIFVDQAIVQKYFQIALKVQTTPPKLSEDKIREMQRQQQILKGENPNGDHPAG